MRVALARLSLPIVLFASLFLTFAYFQHAAAGWNVNSRLALVYAMVDEGTFAIDNYHDSPKMDYLMTGDKAVFRGHYYCDKSPALSFMGAPVYWVLSQARERFGLWRDLPHGAWVLRTRYLMRVAAVSFPAALLGALLWIFAVRFGANEESAFLIALAIMLGTVLAGYGTLFYPYLPASLCTMWAYWLLLPRGGEGWPEATGGDGGLGRGWRLFWAGLLIGLAWFLDLTSGLAGLALTAYALWHMRGRCVSIWKLVVGGLIPVFVFFIYTYSIFGEPAIPYKYEHDDLFREEMAKGFQGIHWPTLTVFYYLLLHPFKSLPFYSPIVILAVVGMAHGFREGRGRGFRADAVLAASILAAYLFYNSGYYMWWGGWAAGPRLLCPAMPFLAVPLVWWLACGSSLRRVVFGLMAGLSIAWNFQIMAVNPQIPTGIETSILLNATISHNLPSAILFDIAPSFWGGYLALNFGTQYLGLPGLWALAPLAAMWGAVGFWLIRRSLRGGGAASGRGE